MRRREGIAIFLVLFSLFSIPIYAFSFGEFWEGLRDIFRMPPLTVIKTSATANTVCSISGNTATCSIGDYVGAGCGANADEICIDGVTADGMSAFFSSRNFHPNYCEYSCSYSGYGGISGSTGTVIGSVGNGCSGSFNSYTGYHGGNAFQVNCGVTFREVATTTTTTIQIITTTTGITTTTITVITCPEGTAWDGERCVSTGFFSQIIFIIKQFFSGLLNQFLGV